MKKINRKRYENNNRFQKTVKKKEGTCRNKFPLSVNIH